MPDFDCGSTGELIRKLEAKVEDSQAALEQMERERDEARADARRYETAADYLSDEEARLREGLKSIHWELGCYDVERWQATRNRACDMIDQLLTSPPSPEGDCPDCGGDCSVGCDRCDTVGVVYMDRGAALRPLEVTCPKCGGRGDVICPTCKGTGRKK